MDGSGNAYVTGLAESADFPTTSGAFQITFGGGAIADSFVTKLNAGGTALAYSTYLGGSGFDEGFSIAVDGSGDAYVTGRTSSTNFATTPGAFQTSLSGTNDAYLTELNPDGSGLAYSTYLGGSTVTIGRGIAVDLLGNVYVTGYTTSSDFPTTAGAFQTNFGGGTSNAFVSKFDLARAPIITDVVLSQDIAALNSGVTGTAQRSMVEDIVYTFSEPVNIVNNIIDPNLFQINALTVNGITGVVPATIEWAPVAGSGNAQWEVDFGVNPAATNSQTGAQLDRQRLLHDHHHQFLGNHRDLGWPTGRHQRRPRAGHREFNFVRLRPGQRGLCPAIVLSVVRRRQRR